MKFGVEVIMKIEIKFSDENGAFVFDWNKGCKWEAKE